MDIMKYLDNMDQINSDILQKTLEELENFDYQKITSNDVLKAIQAENCTIDDFKALLSPKAKPFLEQMAQKALLKTRNHFGNSVSMYTPIYISNFCESDCIYCGFSCKNKINRKKLNLEEIEKEMQEIAKTGLKEILILTGESRRNSTVSYIAQSIKIAKKYFDIIGLEVYPLNCDEYKFLHECGADYVSVYQETYNIKAYEKFHLAGEKRVFPYRFYAQERALIGDMRGVAFGSLLGLDDFRKDAFATGLHAYFTQKKYPHAEISFSCPRLRPIVNNKNINPKDVFEKELLQVMTAFRIFLPFANISISTRESENFRDNIIGICATKISAGVCTGIGTRTADEKGDEQFEISDERSVEQVYKAILKKGMQPVLSDYIYV